MIDEKKLLPEHYLYREQPFYQGDGVLNVLELERLCRHFQEYAHQQNVIKYELMRIINEQD